MNWCSKTENKRNEEECQKTDSSVTTPWRTWLIRNVLDNVR
jgi:hypothetical protein